jgi:ribulose kinase
MCASVGAGVYPNIASAAQGMSTKMLIFHPQRKTSEFYDIFYSKVYVGLYDSISEKLAKTRRLALNIK